MKYQFAIECGCKPARQIRPDKCDRSDTHYNLGIMYGKRGDYQKAIQWYEASLQIKPDHSDTHYNLGIMYGEIGDYQKAQECYKQAIQIKPDDAQAHYALGITYLLINQRSKSLDEYKILKGLNHGLVHKELADKLCVLAVSYPAVQGDTILNSVLCLRISPRITAYY